MKAAFTTEANDAAAAAELARAFAGLRIRVVVCFCSPQHDGALLRLRSLHAGYDPTDRRKAMACMQEYQARGEIATGLLYVDPLATRIHVVNVPTACARSATGPTTIHPRPMPSAAISHFGACGQRSDFAIPTEAPIQIAQRAT